jgi:mono/diheme cytochrome c family protein
MRNLGLVCLAIGFTVLVVACGSGAPTTVGTPTSLPPASVAPTDTQVPSAGVTASPTVPAQGTVAAQVSQQVSAGQQVYSAQCAVCHGADLQGVTGPALTQSYVAAFGDAMSLVNYISQRMPLTAPGSLTQQQYYDVTANILDKDGLLPAGTTLTPQNASTISLSAPSSSTPTGPAGTPAAQQQVVVAAIQIPSVGNVMADSQGSSLYYNSDDGPNHSTCSGVCADTWPPLTVSQGVHPELAPGIPGQLGVFQRADGSFQVVYTNPPTYDQVPLYTYFNDLEPGDRNGNLLLGIWSNIVLPVTTTVAVAPTSPTASGTVTATVAPGQGVAALGVADYLLNCSTCHGAQGQGVDAPPLRNSTFVQTAGDQVISKIITDGMGGGKMPAWLQANGGPLTAFQIANIVAYLHTLQGVSSVPSATPVPPEPTETPLPPGAPTPEPARPSEPGGPGAAATMVGSIAQGRPMFGLYCAACHGPEGVQGVANPDSDDEAVPPLNPVDPTIANSDPKIFSYNLDLYLQNGSIPEGEGPLLVMPGFGASNMLTQSQIADLIAYVMSLNGVEFAGAATATPAVQATATPPPAVQATPTPTPAVQGTAAAAAAQQVAAGQQVYTQSCSVCHGANLQGVSGPPLSQALISTFGDAKGLVDFISAQMPLTAPGSLSQQQYYDVTAYILDKDGLLPANTTLTPANASTISLTASPSSPTTAMLGSPSLAQAAITTRPIAQLSAVHRVGHGLLAILQQLLFLLGL